MALQTTSIGAFTAVYIGPFGSSSPLPLIKSVRTEGATFTESLPTEFVESLGIEVQNDNYSISLDLQFYGTADEVYSLARGQAAGTTGLNVNKPFGINYYQILLVGATDNYYFPKVKANSVNKLAYKKDSATVTAITFGHQQRSVINPLVYKGTYAQLVSNYMPAGTAPF